MAEGMAQAPGRPRLVIWGASGHALVVADIVRLGDRYDVVGFLDSVSPGRQGQPFAGKTVLGGQEQLAALRRQGVDSLIVAVGDCQARLSLAALAQAVGFSLAVAVHPAAIVARDVEIGAGTVVAAGCAINPGTRIGANVIVNTGAIVDHECVVEDGVHLGPGVHLAGRVSIGRGTWLGIGTTVSDKVRIGAGSVVGAGSLVLRDIPDGVVAYGVPARTVRKNDLCGAEQ